MILNASGCLDALAAPDVARSLDAFVTKTVTPLPRDGNAPVRVAETDVGMLNMIGLANPGIDAFVAETLPSLAALGVPIWVSVGGFAAGDYADSCARLDGRPEVAAIAMSGSSLLVAINALLLKRARLEGIRPAGARPAGVGPAPSVSAAGVQAPR